MKNLLYLCLVVFTIISCKTEQKKDYAIFSGKLINGDLESFNISNRNFNKKVKINDDGTFKDSIKITNIKTFELFFNEVYRGAFYLENGYNLNIEINSDRSAEKRVKFSGVGSESNTFLLKKEELKYRILNEFSALMKLNETEFSEKIKILFSKKTDKFEDLFNTTPNLSEAFKKLQYKDLNFEVYMFYLTYVKIKKGENSNYIPPKNFLPKELNSFKIDNDALYNNSNSYASLCSMLINENWKLKKERNTITVNYLDSLLTNIKIKQLQTKWIMKNKNTLLDANKTHNAKAYYSYFMNDIDIDENLKSKLKTFYIKSTKLIAGAPSPKFFDYKNYDGSTTSLNNFKGKYVFMDIWATWCGPCKKEFPFLKELEEKYHSRNIAFVSVSVDKKSHYQAWKDMVKEKELGGVQLFADNAFNSTFIKAYNITSIPRFILIDPEGNIVSERAPKPSDPKLIELFDSLKL